MAAHDIPEFLQRTPEDRFGWHRPCAYAAHGTLFEETSVGRADQTRIDRCGTERSRDLGLIEIRDSKPIDVTELDVIKNPGGIKIVPLEAAQAPRALEDVDFAAVQGNFPIYSGLKLTNAFALEKMTTPYINVVAVKRGNAESQWAQDIVASYKSQTFKTAILSDRFYDDFTLPDYLK